MYTKTEVIKQFVGFSSQFKDKIDTFINNYYVQKQREARFDYQKEMFLDILKFCTRAGKRIRPLLVLISYLGYKKWFCKTDAIVKLAATLEIMHSMLLIQDDIVDKSIIRRGGPSIHIMYGDQYKHNNSNDTIGSDVAIIIADVMFSNCLEIISTSSISSNIKIQFLNYFSQTYEKTAWGQILDILYSNNTTVDHEDKSTEYISEMKTAYYTLVFPLEMGYVLTGKNRSHEIENIKEFAFPLGMAFQLRDDILGVFGDVKQIGKSIDSDILEGKKTLLVQNTVKLLESSEREKFILLFSKGEKNKKDIIKIKELMVSTGALNETISRHEYYIDQSLKALERMHISQHFKKVLYGIVEMIRKIALDEIFLKK